MRHKTGRRTTQELSCRPDGEEVYDNLKASYLAHIRGRHDGIQDWREVLGEEASSVQGGVREDRQDWHLNRQDMPSLQVPHQGLLYAECSHQGHVRALKRMPVRFKARACHSLGQSDSAQVQQVSWDQED